MKQVINLAILSFCLLIFAAACNEESSVNNPVTNSVSGYLMTNEGTPISDAIVEATDSKGNVFSTSFTNEAGNFEITNIPDDENAIVSFIKNDVVIKQIKLNTLVNMSAKGGKTDILLGGQYDYDAVFAVKVIDNNTSEPIENAYVVFSTSEKAKFAATTDADGFAYLNEIMPGRYFIYITHNNYLPYSESTLLLFPENMDTISFTFPMMPRDSSNTGGNDSLGNDTCCNNSLKVYVTDGNKSPVPNCLVKLNYANSYNNPYLVGYTDRNGLVLFDSMLCTGRYSISIEKDGYEGYSSGVYLYCDEHKTVSVLAIKKQDSTQDCCDNVLYVIYKDVNGNLINCGTAKITEANGTQKTAVVNNGLAKFTGLCNKRSYNFVTTIEGCNVVYDVVSLNSNNAPAISFPGCEDTLERRVILKEFSSDTTVCCNNSISVQVLDTINPKSIIDDAVVEIYLPGNIGSTLIGVAKFINGEYILDGLCTGKYYIRAVYNGAVQELNFSVTCNERIRRGIYF